MISKYFNLICIFLITLVLTACDSTKTDIDTLSVEKHICDASFSSLITHEQYIEGAVTSYESISNELFSGADLLINIKSADGKTYSFIVPEAGGWPLGFRRHFYGYYEGQNLRIYYDGTYNDNDINSAVVKAVTDDTEWSIQCVYDFQEELMNIYNSSGEVIVCCSEMAIKSIIEYLDLTGFEKKTLSNGFIYYNYGTIDVYCCDVNVIDNSIFYTVRISNKDDNPMYLVNQKTGEIKFVI